MKIVLAFDSFKNCLPSPEVCNIMQEAMRKTAPELELISLPLADGGEGTARAITTACSGVIQKHQVHDPLFRLISAEYGLLPDNSAVLEMASASGIELITPAERNPMQTTTYGTGELLSYLAVKKNIRSFTIGIGGSATVDGGVGMLQALGVKFYNAKNELIPCPADGIAVGSIAGIDASGLLPEIKASTIRIASDVTNPLCGKNGAAKVFAPQKGADDAMVETLEKNLFNFGMLSVKSDLADNITTPGDGAAGGLGFALRNYLNAEIISGAELVLQLLKFDDAVKDADWVITGEGCSDFQTAHGKLCSVVASHCRKAGVPIILLSGALGEKAEELENIFDAVFSLTAKPCTLNEALDYTPENLRRMARNIVNLITKR
ncbi:MAG: glycerate kinase [Lentisphaeria bacterium]|nr:glycerate kinase [Lentisphaeria bacterium]